MSSAVHWSQEEITPHVSRMENLRQLEIVIFEVEGIAFGTEVEQVIEILESPEIEDPPELSDVVRGTIPFRGESLPVVALAEQYKLISSKKSQAAPVIVIGTADGCIGIRVDSIQDFKPLSIDQIEPLPPLIGRNISVHSIWGMGKLADDEVILLIHLDEI
ncbi:chemotaxis protein CheW [Candidatus Poribacteria bacterium]|nr:chemotaxis protein CheW [Candidatus Poribacteria bacterium]